jgi:hypothetical protein
MRSHLSDLGALLMATALTSCSSSSSAPSSTARGNDTDGGTSSPSGGSGNPADGNPIHASDGGGAVGLDASSHRDGGGSEHSDAHAATRDTGGVDSPQAFDDAPGPSEDAPVDAKLDSTGKCSSNSQCASGHCADGGCAAATCTDGIKDGNETDVDCGGGTCPACPVGDTCLQNSDCTSDGCDYSGHCALSPSCTQHHGGDTCGAGEDTDLGPNATPATNEESCCTSIAIPGTSYTVDKYMITAGRIRAFVNRFGGNLRSFTETIPTTNTWWNPQWNQYIPSTESEVDLQLGPYPAPLTPNPYPPTDDTMVGTNETAGNWLGQWRDGCSMGKSGSPDGARTWWTDYAIGSDEAPIVYPQDFLDDKTINCIDSYMLTAFCIWDGGHLATDAELEAAWGPGPLPWSAVSPNVTINTTSQEPEGTDSQGRDMSSYVVHEFGTSMDEFMTPFTYNYDPYSLFADDSYHIGAPGRFPLGAGPAGHMDLVGAAYEATAITAGSTGQEPPPTPTKTTQVDYVGTLQQGSWEIHPIYTGTGAAVDYTPWMPAYWAYWAMTGRCAR